MTDQPTPETPAVEEEPMAAAETPVEDEPMATAETAPEPETEPATAAAETPVEDEPMATAEPQSEPAAVDAPVEDEPQAAPADAPESEPATPAAAEAPAEDAPIAAAAAEPEAEAAPKRGERKAPPPVDASERPAGPRGLQLKYRSDVVPALVKQFEYKNPNQVPRLEKIVVNVGLGEALTNAKAVDAASGDLTTITGQKPIVMKARRSIAQFKIRTGNPIGLKVTLRGERMWDFLERLTILTLPRIRDFRGIPSKSFDGRGNYTLGLREQIAFPEIDYDKVDRLRGLEVSIVTTAKTDEESKRLLELLGMPFAS
jgi:large subunit ribosomal protein L5